jgi:threonine/homoserine/homoserine lactone efflux protein
MQPVQIRRTTPGQEVEGMTALLLGLGLGFGAGVAPGPTLALAVSSTLQRGFRAGLQVAMAPMITDGPIAVVTLLALNVLPREVVVAMAALGGAFVIYLGIETLREARTGTVIEAGLVTSRRDLWRAALVNVLNPHPWIFWLAIGGPLVRSAWARTPLHAVAFVVGFYAILVGSKAAISWAVAFGKKRVSHDWYQRVLVVAGVMLMATGVRFSWYVFTNPSLGGR